MTAFPCSTNSIQPGQHQALVRRGTTLHVANVPTERPAARGLLIAPSFVGICGTDLQILNGSRPDTAEILGHEGLGVVVESGPDARMQVGRSVLFNPCAQLCEGRILGHNVRGLFQQYIAVGPDEMASGLVLPARACNPPIAGALVEPIAAAIYAHELILRVARELRTVAVFGAGPIGLLTAIYLKEMGARVILIHPNAARLNTAIALGLIDTASVIAARENAAESILAQNNGHPLDAAVICTTRHGAPSALAQAVEVVKSSGCIDLVANYPECAPAPDGLSTDAIRACRASNVCGIPKEGHYLVIEKHGRRIALTGHRGTSPDHLLRAMQILESRGFAYAKVITHILSLHEAMAAIQTLSISRSQFLNAQDCIKAVIDMTRSRSASPL